MKRLAFSMALGAVLAIGASSTVRAGDVSVGSDFNSAYIWRGINSFVLAASARPRDCATSRCTITDSASTRSVLISISSLTRGAAWKRTKW